MLPPSRSRKPLWDQPASKIHWTRSLPPCIFGGMDVKVNRIVAPGVLLAALTLFVLGTACGSEPAEPTAAPAPTDTVVPQATAQQVPTTAPPTPVPPTETPAPQAGESAPEVGINVGNLAPDFKLRLVDGSELTSAQLRDEGRPVLLYFLTSW